MSKHRGNRLWRVDITLNRMRSAWEWHQALILKEDRERLYGLLV